MVVIVVIDVKIRKIVFVVNIFVSKDRLVKIRLKINVFSGIFFLVNFVNVGFVIFCFVIVYSIWEFV